MAEGGRLPIFNDICLPPAASPPAAVNLTPAPPAAAAAPRLAAPVPWAPPPPPIVIAPTYTARPQSDTPSIAHVHLIDQTMRSVLLPTSSPNQVRLQVFCDFYFYVQNVGVIVMSGRMTRLLSVRATTVLRDQ